MDISKEERLSELRKAISSLDGSAYASDSPVPQQCGSDDAYQRTIKLISIKDRPVSYVRERLSQEGFDEASIDYAIGRACRFGLLDDARYADALSRTRLRSGKGRRGVEQELVRIGISPDVVDFEGIISDLCMPEELERALDLLEKHPPKCKNIRDGAFRKLYQKGFSSEVCSQAAGIWASRQYV